MSHRKVVTSQLLWFFLWAVVTAFGIYLSPSAEGHGTHQQLGLPPCPSVLLFDRPCPGCGLTTSWTAFLHGNFRLAFHAHPLGPLLYLGFTAVGWSGFWAWVRKLRFRTEEPIFSRLSISCAIAFIGFGVVRAAVTPHYASQTERWYRSLSSLK